MLFPRESETRELKDLSGLWKFKVDFHNEGREKEWFKKPLDNTEEMAVPASYNDISQDPAVRDHVGDVWYEKEIYVSNKWQGDRIVLRIGSATHYGALWINGKFAVDHQGGYTPFEADITELVKLGERNRITICVNNELSYATIPPGRIEEVGGRRIQKYFHDFFNYSGLHRPVRLYTTPSEYIKDINVTTDYEGTEGVVKYRVETSGASKLKLTLIDAGGGVVGEAEGVEGIVTVKDVILWQPGRAYLYTLLVRIVADDETTIDNYRIPVGIRTVQVEGDQFLINGKPFYFKGFGKHEDMDIKGKGLDHVINLKDFNLMKWMGANSFRTSHYPYSEEIMNMADREGFVVINETPAVGLYIMDHSADLSGMPEQETFSKDAIGDETLKAHLQSIRELIERDRNHPSVVMWSVANEPAGHEEGALPYFEKVAEETRKLDSTRPICCVNIMQAFAGNCKISHLFDVLCLNRYFGWYPEFPNYCNEAGGMTPNLV